MTKPSSGASGVVDDTPERLVRLLPETDRKAIEKEIRGLMAKLKWDHMAEPLKAVWRERIRELEEALRA